MAMSRAIRPPMSIRAPNSIDGGALANASGVPIVIQNSGANVLIQNATIINLQMR